MQWHRCVKPTQSMDRQVMNQHINDTVYEIKTAGNISKINGNASGCLISGGWVQKIFEAWQHIILDFTQGLQSYKEDVRYLPSQGMGL